MRGCSLDNNDIESVSKDKVMKTTRWDFIQVIDYIKLFIFIKKKNRSVMTLSTHLKKDIGLSMAAQENQNYRKFL